MANSTRSPPVEILTDAEGVAISARTRGASRELAVSTFGMDEKLSKMIDLMRVLILHVEKITGDTITTDDLE